MPDNQQPAAISSPTSTGGAGTFFEQHVDAFWLSLLLVRGIPPVLIDCQIEEVSFQTEHLGWHTDDVLVRCRTGSSRQRRLAAQIKRTFTVSASNEDCVATFKDFWRDFTNPTVFIRESDIFAIIIRQGTHVLLGHFGALLDCARTAPDARDFLRRLGTPGLLNAKSVSFAGEIRSILDSANGAAVTDEDLWLFLRHVHVLSLDLDSPTRQTESFIRNLLAQSASTADPSGVAEATWLRLLTLAAEAMEHAGSYTWERLPEELRTRHSPISTADHAALRTLRDRTRTLRRTIRSDVGHAVHVPREALVAKVDESLRSTRVVVITGPAGVGKSAIGDEVFGQLQIDRFAFAFRAEEFATAHLDTALQHASIPLTAEHLSGLLAGQGAKTILIESVERLLEKETRDAFTDLLALVRDDPRWQLILTCRDYCLDTVRSSFLDYIRIPYTVVDVPLLSEEELTAALIELPQLQRPATSQPLRELFRNPYILDKAASMAWPEDALLPADERTFRQKFWREVVREDQFSGDGMPQRRSDAFCAVALRRARALDAYAPCSDLDAAALEKLHQRDLISYSDDSTVLAAPAHDVLEDWAIHQWIEHRSNVHGRSFQAFIQELGTHPAIRRSYRKWLGESLVCDSARADVFVQTVIRDASLPSQFRDDTLVAVLRSSTAEAFLSRHNELLLDDGASLLRRVIHLVRVACKTTPTWLPPGVRIPPLYFVPEGDAWAAILHMIRANLTGLLPQHLSLIVGFLRDWTGTIHAEQPMPPGSVDAAAVAHALLPYLTGYRSEKSLQDVVRLIALVPRADEAAFRALIAGTIDRTVDRGIAEAVSDLLLTSLQAYAACRDVPDAVIELAERRFYLTEANVANRQFDFLDMELEPIFGLKDCGTNDFFPSSALQGPFLLLLQQHSDLAIPFILRLMNRAGEWYCERRCPRIRPLEPAWETEFTLSDKLIRQWCNPRLWMLYRGTSVGPHLLQCALMALEQWLLNLCRTAPAEVEPHLIRLLRESRTASISAVVASVATAHPQLAGAAAVALLTSEDFVRIDTVRMVHEASAPSRILGAFPRRADHALFDQDRTASDALQHRKLSLEWTAIRLQGGPFKQAVEQVLDNHLSRLPPADQQTDDDRLWRIALHRMDLREYTVRRLPPEPAVPSADATPAPDLDRQPTRLLLEPDPLAPDIQAMLDRDASAEATQNAAMSLFMWAFSVFQRHGTAGTTEAQWRARLVEAQAVPADAPDEGDPWTIRTRDRGVEFTAAVCVRDHWDELTPDERDWCVNTLCHCVTLGADSTNELQNCQRGGMDSARAAAFVLPLVHTKPLSESQRPQVLRALAVGLTHAADEVVDYAVEGISQFLWLADPDLCRTCVGALARAARLLDLRLEEQRRRPFPERTSAHEFERQIAEDVRRDITERKPATEDDVRLDSGDWYARHVSLRTLVLLATQVDDSLARVAYANAVQLLVEARSETDDDRRDVRHDYEWEMTSRQLIAKFALRLPEQDALQFIAPILEMIVADHEEVAELLDDLIVAEDELGTTGTFWVLWQAIADRACQSTWPASLDGRHAEHDKLLRSLFLGIPWKAGVRHWKSLDGNAGRITQLFLNLPPAAAVLVAFVDFLLSIGSKSLPWAFARIANHLRQGDPREMLSLPNTVGGLEVLLGRYVYAVPAFLKSKPVLRDAILYLLDELVEAGSSAAYRMRDDFVTPLPPA